MVNELSVFELLSFYCIFFNTYTVFEFLDF